MGMIMRQRWEWGGGELPQNHSGFPSSIREALMKRYLVRLMMLAAMPVAFAQAPGQNPTTGSNILPVPTLKVPEIPFDSVPNFLKLPPNLYLGEAAGVAVNSKGHVFVYSRGDNDGP